MVTNKNVILRKIESRRFEIFVLLFLLASPLSSLFLLSSSNTKETHFVVSSFKPSAPQSRSRSIPATKSISTSANPNHHRGYQYTLKQRRNHKVDRNHLLPRLPSALHQSFETKETKTTVQSKEKEEENKDIGINYGAGDYTNGDSGRDSSDNVSGGISDLDARVLQSLLDDKELDLKSEENLKKMLENNMKGKTAATEKGRNVNSNDPSSDSEYSSTFFKTVSDSSLWNSVRAKADEVLESTKIFIQNRIERDAKLLASISLFAWERALNDVGRALPAAGETGTKVAETMRKAVFALASNSSFVENTSFNLFNNGDDDGDGGRRRSSFLLSSTSTFLNGEQQEKQAPTTTYEKLTTPRDEIQKVSESIRDILSGKTVNPSLNSDRSLRSIAPAGTSIDRINERQRKAFQRRKETLLLREKESIDKKVIRAASSVTDAAWEIKREMEIEGNEAGYRSEAVMKRIEGSITSSALLEGGKNWIGKRLGGARNRDNEIPKLESSTSFQKSDVMNVNDEKIDEFALESKMDSIQDAVVIPVESNVVVENIKNIEPDIVKVGATETTASLNGEGNELDKLVEEVTGSDVYAERARLISVLRLCLEEPEESWLRPDLLPASISEPLETKKEDITTRPFFLFSDDDDGDDTMSDEEAWEDTITAMVSAKNELEAVSSLDTKEKSKEEMISDLYEMQKIVEAITNSVAKSAGEASAEFLRMEMLGETSALSSSQGSSGKRDSVDIVEQVDKQSTTFQETVEAFDTQSMQDKSLYETNSDILQGVLPVNNMASSFTEERQDKSNVSDDGITGFTEVIPTVVVADLLPSEEEIPFQSSTVRSNNNKVEILSDVDFEINTSKKFEKINGNNFDSDEFAVADVEVVINGDDDIMQDANTMNSAAVAEEESLDKEKRDNVVIQFTLRTLDVLFFVAEKSLTVGLPGVLNAYETVGQKTELINRNGLGKEGWETLENVNDARNRY